MNPRWQPGGLCWRLAERTLDALTLETVICPAIADLQHECATATGSATSRRVMRWRAHWGVWKAFGLCLASNIVGDPQGIVKTLGSRTLTILTVISLVLFAPILLSVVLPFGREFGSAQAFTAALLLLPQIFAAALPAAFFLAVALQRDAEPPRSPILPALVTGTVGCMLATWVLLLIVVPTTNERYRSLVHDAMAASTGDGRFYLNDGRFFLSSPRKGLAEMTWWELNDYIADPPSVPAADRARAFRLERLAFVGLVAVLGVLGRALSNRWPSRVSTLGAAFLLLVPYYAVFSASAAGFTKPVLQGPWTVNVLFLLIGAMLLHWRPMSMTRGVMS
jgi:hypothetical protein